ncbi:MAG: hypothetical protein OIF56_12920 [Cohaesibacter sp.]|nr:hypothetical protein [Cohaesibacter sp.]
MDRTNQPLWLRLLNALTLLALFLFVFVYQIQLGEWPAFLLVLIICIGAGVNFVIHLRDAIASHAQAAKKAQADPNVSNKDESHSKD